jgi:hypothetical protein
VGGVLDPIAPEVDVSGVLLELNPSGVDLERPRHLLK